MTFENLRPTGSYEHEGEFQAEPANLAAIVDEVAGREHNSGVADKMTDPSSPRGAALPGRIDDELLERLTAPISYAHDASDYTTTVTAPLYANLRELRDKLQESEDAFYAATAKGASAASRAIVAAKAAIVAGEPVPNVDVVDVAAEQARHAATYGALVQLVKEASGKYRTACEKAAPAARAAAAARLAGEVADVRAKWADFVEASDRRFDTVELLVGEGGLNYLVDADFRGLESSGDRKRDRRNGGLIPVEAADLAQLDESFAAAAAAMKVIATAVGSNDDLRTGLWAAEDLDHGPWPKWFRRYARSVDAAWLDGIERESGLVVDLDAVESPEVESPEVESTSISTTRRTRKRSV